ncbi:MAG: thioredoxin family protein, partial [Elusimicrobia bacterium]|nr:thioredoxin family protein [Elusimicrobiota bacterium]
MSACPSRFTLVTLVTLVALVASLASVSAEVTWHDSWDKARNEAQASGRPILIDFTAAWCYSCYYMEKNVLDEPAFHQAAEKFIMLKMDVDRPQGRDLRERYGARFLPSYILVNRDGREIGRVVGEQTEHDFIRQIEGLLGQKSHDPVEEAVGNLKNHLSAGRLNQAKKEIASMPAGQKKFLNQSLEWRLLKARLDLKTAKKTERAQGVRPLRFLLENEAGCDLAYDISNGNELLENLAPQISRPVYESEKEALQKLTDKRFFITGDDR